MVRPTTPEVRGHEQPASFESATIERQDHSGYIDPASNPVLFESPTIEHQDSSLDGGSTNGSSHSTVGSCFALSRLCDFLLNFWACDSV